jgi:hypothetical protein
MTTTQRPRPQRPAAPAPNPASRGLILVAVAVVLGIILLVKGGGVGFEGSGEDLTIDADSSGEETPVQEAATTTTEAPPETSVAPAALTIVALNGAGLDGYAGAAQQFLSVAGYTSTTAATAATQTAETVVYYAPGFEVDAATVAALFGLDLTAVQPLPEGTQLARDPAELPAGTNVVVWLGPDVQNVIEGSGTTTTVAGGDATTTTTTTG